MEHHSAQVNGIRLHWVSAGHGPPVYLLHGFPEFWYAWRHQIPALAQRYQVIAPDLRGYGYSGKPADGYDKRTMAGDIAELARRLEHDRIAVVGHDRGARVALRLAKDHPDRLDRLAVLDNVPIATVFERMDARLAAGQWWLQFNQVPGLPEALIAGREEVWLRHIFAEWCYNPQALAPADLAEYVRVYRLPGAVTGACNDYRAGPQDVAQDEADAGVTIDCPVLALWGAEFAWVAKAYDVAAIWARLAPDLRTVVVPECGHLPHEERPDEVNRHLLQFLAQ